MSSFEKFLLPISLTSISPSAKDGIQPYDEQQHRRFGSELISQSVEMLILKQNVCNTAQNLLHRFYYRKSFKKYDVFTISMGAVLLASKIEEEPKILREIIFVFHQIHQIRHGRSTIVSIEIGGTEYNDWKNELITTERYLLKELGFSFYSIQHPHQFLPAILKRHNYPESVATSSALFLNLSMKLDYCVMIPPDTIALASVIYAVSTLALNDQCNSLQALQTPLIDDIIKNVTALFRFPDIVWLQPLCEVDYYPKYDHNPPRQSRFRDRDTTAES